MFVFNASTLILLAKSELLENFLRNVGQTVAIPKEVERECCGVKQSLDARVIQKAIDEKRLGVVAVKNKGLLMKIQDDFPVGKGEAEAIALAVSEEATLVGIDDRQGIHACKLLGIPFTTAIGILIRLREKGLLEKDEAMTKVQALEKHGRYRAAILRDARRILEGEQ